MLDHERLVGIVTLGDVRNAYPSDATRLRVYELAALLDRVTTAALMRMEVVTIGADAPVIEAVQVMLEQKTSELLVLEHGRVVGMITQSDILGTLLAGQIPLPSSTIVPTQLLGGLHNDGLADRVSNSARGPTPAAHPALRLGGRGQR